MIHNRRMAMARLQKSHDKGDPKEELGLWSCSNILFLCVHLLDNWKEARNAAVAQSWLGDRRRWFSFSSYL